MPRCSVNQLPSALSRGSWVVMIHKPLGMQSRQPLPRRCHEPCHMTTTSWMPLIKLERAHDLRAVQNLPPNRDDSHYSKQIFSFGNLNISSSDSWCGKEAQDYPIIFISPHVTFLKWAIFLIIKTPSKAPLQTWLLPLSSTCTEILKVPLKGDLTISYQEQKLKAYQEGPRCPGEGRLFIKTA